MFSKNKQINYCNPLPKLLVYEEYWLKQFLAEPVKAYSGLAVMKCQYP